jgi:leucyl aminopeptidase
VTLRVTVKVVALEQVRTDLFVIASGKLHDKLPDSLLGLDAAAGGSLRRAVEAGDFTGERDQAVLVYPARGSKRVLLLGLGDHSEVTRSALRVAAAVGARRAIAMGARTMALYVTQETHPGVPADALGQVTTEGVYQGAWRFVELKAVRDDKSSSLEAVDLIVPRELRGDADRGRVRGVAIGVGQRLARNLQMLPSNVCTPSYLGHIARELGRAYGFRVTILARPQLEKEGMNALLSVAQGSQEEPRFIALEYRGAGRDAPVCLVGKGVTFDSGGISIKPAERMEEMKYDMSGAAAVLGAFEMLGQLKPAINVVGLVPATENLPSGTATKPGDVVRSHLGKTIEIVNTDAEGRLILADTLSYARRYKPACVLDAATLTGAVVIGLGHHATGLMGNDDRLIDEVRKAGDLAGERCWPLPLWDEYREQIRSDVADVKNTGGRPAGSITAGWFLREFVDGYAWAHLDIAGTAYIDGERPGLAKGPTGLGVRLFSEFVLARVRG